MRDIFASKMEHLGSEGAFEVLAKAKLLEQKGHNVIHLEIGEPDFPTPKNIVNACIKALQEGHTHYAPSYGILPLREAVARHLAKTRFIPEPKPEEIVICAGVKPLVFFLLLATINQGDEVIYATPSYPAYESVINYTGGTKVTVPLLEENDFRFSPEVLEEKITPKTKWIILNSPSNPTGGVLTREDLEKVAQMVQKHDLLVMADEIYSDLIYEGEHVSIVSIDGMKERTVLLDGFSKTYAMTGWRLAYGMMPVPIAQKLTQLIMNSNACTCTFVQMAGIEALEGDRTEVEAMKEEFRKRRDFVVEGLNKINGITCRKPKGAFYVFPNIKQLGLTSGELANDLLYEADVALLSGISFGKAGEGYLRLSYANSIANLQTALERIEAFLRKKSQLLVS